MKAMGLGAVLVLSIVGSGCKKEFVPEPPKMTSYATRDFEWDEVQRIVIMPIANRSSVPSAPEQVQQALAAELQRSGRFEVVVARNDSLDPKTEDVFISGKFDEEELLRVKQRYQAQGVMFVQITQYTPYNPPQLGISVLLVSPAEAVVISAIDGLWDMRDTGTLGRARHYASNSLAFPDSLFGNDRMLDSPQTFQRFVAYEVAQVVETATHKPSPPPAMFNPESMAGNAMPGSTPLPTGPSITPVSQQAFTPAPVPSAE